IPRAGIRRSTHRSTTPSYERPVTAYDKSSFTPLIVSTSRLGRTHIRERPQPDPSATSAVPAATTGCLLAQALPPIRPPGSLFHTQCDADPSSPQPSTLRFRTHSTSREHLPRPKSVPAAMIGILVVTAFARRRPPGSIFHHRARSAAQPPAPLSPPLSLTGHLP